MHNFEFMLTSSISKTATPNYLLVSLFKSFTFVDVETMLKDDYLSLVLQEMALGWSSNQFSYVTKTLVFEIKALP
jgi:hypothetical protein